jgi:RecJ-like exonuclease
MNANSIIQNHVETEFLGYNRNEVGVMPLANSKQVETFENFLKFYDIAEKFVDKLESLGDEADEHVEAVESLIMAIEENTETIIEYYVKYVKSGKALKGVELQKIEFAMKHMQDAIKKFKKAQEDLGYEVNFDI